MRGWMEKCAQWMAHACVQVAVTVYVCGVCTVTAGSTGTLSPGAAAAALCGELRALSTGAGPVDWTKRAGGGLVEEKKRREGLAFQAAEIWVQGMAA